MKETGVHGEWIMDINGRFNRAELRCGRQEDIDRVCGPKGLRKRDKRHYFCANGNFLDKVNVFGLQRTEILTNFRRMDKRCRQSSVCMRRQQESQEE